MNWNIFKKKKKELEKIKRKLDNCFNDNDMNGGRFLIWKEDCDTSIFDTYNRLQNEYKLLIRKQKLEKIKSKI